MRLLRRAIRRERQLQLAFSLALVICAVAFGYVFFLKKNILATFGLIGALIGLRLLWEVLRQPGPENDRLWKLLHQQPEQIVWVYSVNTVTMPYGLHLWNRGTLYFNLLDGDQVAVSLPAHKLRMVSKFLNRLLPYTAFGYTEERRQQFEADPASLLRRENDEP